MGFMDFFLNGGLMGAVRGFDHEEEGRPYSFQEFEEDVPRAINTINIARGALDSLSSGVSYLIDDEE